VVRATTGYAIGGVPPFGHVTRTRVLAALSLLEHDVVWAAAGTPYVVVPMDPKTLIARRPDGQARRPC
jgi:prolyl-tRNA editing enzyme YbaK/EbsC (Cys-tRNA(Pro) deacylase)